MDWAYWFLLGDTPGVGLIHARLSNSLFGRPQSLSYVLIKCMIDE